MKKLFFFFLFIVGCNEVKAQIINFPDANLKAKLIPFDLNSDGEIDINEALDVTHLNLSNNQSSDPNKITDLTGIQYFTNLFELYVDNHNISQINLTGFPNLEQFWCQNTHVTQLNLTGLPNLKLLVCNDNLLTQLDVSTLNNLEDLVCDRNQLTQIDISNLLKLKSFGADDNHIPQINLFNNTKLIHFNMNYCGLTSLDVSRQDSLKNLSCMWNGITNLDVSHNKKLTYLDCNTNDLKTLLLKNGQNLNLNFNNNPNLKYICIDDIQKDSVLPKLALYNNTNVEVNTYCTFEPGGDHNTITGNIIYDLDGNGCDANDPKNIPFTKITLQDGLKYGITYSDTSGKYNLYAGKGIFQITPSIESPTFFSFSPPTTSITFIDSLNNTTIQDFCITPIGSHADVEVILSPIQVARPGFDAHYQLVYKNKGNQILSGTVNLQFNDNLIDLISSSITPISSAVGNLSWNYSNLKPFEIKTIDLTFHVNSPAEIPSVNIGDTLKFTATITPASGDDTPLDNEFNFNQLVVGAYDPNEVTCLEGNIIPGSSIGKYLHYTIDFENTGNFPAENVVVKEMIDPKKFDIQTLQILNSSDKMYTRIKGNQIEYIFEGIQLEEHNHGNILFKLKTRDTLTIGDSVFKSADIYFDYNLPVQTNNAKTTFQNLTAGLDEKMIDQSIIVFPNPSNGVFTIKTENQTKQVEVFDASGRLLIMKIGADNTSKVDITNQEQGIYFLKITTDIGVKVMEVSKN